MMKVKKFKKSKKTYEETYEEFYLIYDHDDERFLDTEIDDYEIYYDKYDLEDTVRYYLESIDEYPDSNFSIIKHVNISKPINNEEVNQIAEKIKMEQDSEKYNL